jgi:hypothetical protein
MRWEHYRPACSVSPGHEIQGWKHPGKCPRCASFMEPGAIPFREWN